MRLLLGNAEVEGERADVVVKGSRVVAIGPRLRPQPDDQVIDCGGGALLPGLHDHHLHLRAMAAALGSVDCSRHGQLHELVTAVRRCAASASDGRWVRVVRYHETIAGHVDRDVLDQWLPGTPLRVQHRSGALWILNSAALSQVAHVLDRSVDVERDASGRATGRLWRYDERLGAALPKLPLDLAGVSEQLSAWGITSVTDATPALSGDGLAVLTSAMDRGEIAQRVTFLGAAPSTSLPRRAHHGPRKILLRDHDLPDVRELTQRIEDAHRHAIPVAVHVVTDEALVLTLTALETAGPLPGDRLEHAALVPHGLEDWIARLGLAVVTQPRFLWERGDWYLDAHDRSDHDSLYRYGTLLGAGIDVAPSSDAPYGSADPWKIIQSASERRTRLGHTVGAADRVAVETVLDGFCRDRLGERSAPRSVRVGQRADLVLLEQTLREVVAQPAAVRVRATLIDGRTVWGDR